MPISYEKLWELAKKHKLNKTQLRDESGITSAALARLSKNKGVSLDALERLCNALDSNIDDVLEFTTRKEERK